MTKKQRPDSSSGQNQKPKLRKYICESDRPLLATTRMPVEVADYLIARSHERGGPYRTTRALADILTKAFLNERPWNNWSTSDFVKSSASKNYEVDRPKAEAFVQFNLFVPADTKLNLEKLAREIGVSLASLLLTAVFWWIFREGHAAQRDPEILNLIESFWRYPELAAHSQ